MLSEYENLKHLYKTSRGDLTNNKWRLHIRKKIDDNTLLEYIAVQDSFWKARYEAVKKISNPKLLGKIATKDKMWSVRFEAMKQVLQVINQITDQELLKDIAVKDKNHEMRLEATKQITDQDFLEDLFFVEKNEKVKTQIINNLTCKDAVFHIYLNENKQEYQQAALSASAGQWDGNSRLFSIMTKEERMSGFVALLLKLDHKDRRWDKVYDEFVGMHYHDFYWRAQGGWETDAIVAGYLINNLLIRHSIDNAIEINEDTISQFYLDLLHTELEILVNLFHQFYHRIHTNMRGLFLIHHQIVLELAKSMMNCDISLQGNLNHINDKIGHYLKYIENGDRKGSDKPAELFLIEAIQHRLENDLETYCKKSLESIRR